MDKQSHLLLGYNYKHIKLGFLLLQVGRSWHESFVPLSVFRLVILSKIYVQLPVGSGEVEGLQLYRELLLWYITSSYACPSLEVRLFSNVQYLPISSWTPKEVNIHSVMVLISLALEFGMYLFIFFFWDDEHLSPSDRKSVV